MKIDVRHLLASILLVVAAAFADAASESLTSFAPPGPLQQKRTYQRYVVKTYRFDGSYGIIWNGVPMDCDGAFEIIRNGVRVYAAYGGNFSIGDLSSQNLPLRIGSNVTGNGQPNLLVWENTLGAHCCTNVHLFEIGDQFRFIQTIEVGDGGGIGFQDVDNDTALEFRMLDWTFAYWNTSFAESPSPEVILKYRDGKYRMAVDLMRKPRLTQNALNRIVAEIRSGPAWGSSPLGGSPPTGGPGLPPVMLWSKMLNLIYAGNATQAWELVRLTWPTRLAGRQRFLREFKTRLRKSPFWNDLLVLNGQNAF